MKVNIGPYPDAAASNTRDREFSIEIDPYDIWSMDHTLAMIIHPMLKLMIDDKHGSPCTSNEDVPEELRTTDEELKIAALAGDLDPNWHKRWEWIMAEMLWTFETIGNEPDFYYELSVEDRQNHDARITNGLRLFGKYFRALWT